MPNITVSIVVATVMFFVLGGLTLLAISITSTTSNPKWSATVSPVLRGFLPKWRYAVFTSKLRSYRKNGERKQRRTHCPICLPFTEQSSKGTHIKQYNTPVLPGVVFILSKKI